jgi:hypothetical protein
VRHPLRIAGGSGRVVEDGRILTPHLDGGERVGAGCRGPLEIQPALAPADADPGLEDVIALEFRDVVAGCDCGHGARVPGAVGDVAGRLHGDAGNGDGAELQAGDHGDLPLGDARQHDQHPVSLPHSLIP